MTTISVERRLLITGATGVVGSALLDILAPEIAQEFEIVALVRSEKSISEFDAKGMRAVVCDLTDTDSIPTVAAQLGHAELTVVVHSAADVAWHHTFEEMHPHNVIGTRNVASLTRATSSSGRFVYVSTAYTSPDNWEYRNAYEQTKAMGQQLLIDEFSDLAPVTFSCSLVVGQTKDGFIPRFHGIYPVFYVLDFVRPPALVGERDCRVDVVPLDWVANELKELVLQVLHSSAPVLDVVASIGRRAPSFADLVNLSTEALNESRAHYQLASLQPTPIIAPRQWKFLESALKVWEVKGISRAPIRTVQALMESYQPYVIDDRALAPSGVTSPAPELPTYINQVVRYWFDRFGSFSAI